MTEPVSPLRSLLAAKGASAEGGVDRILEAVRRHLGMDIAFASRFVGGRREFTHINCDMPAPASPGDSEPQEDTYCYRILQGRLPELIIDAADHPEAADLPITTMLPVGSHLNVPLRLSDGSVYGSFCCLSRRPDHSLTPRDLCTMRAFADLAASEIETELEDNKLRESRIARIEQVIARDEIEMLFQPILRLADRRPVGVECLARFADRDTRTPDRWFAEAAGVGLGVALEMVAVRRAIASLPYIPAHIYVAVNASPDLLLSGELDAALAGIPRGRILVEVTEHQQIADYAQLRAALRRLRQRARLAIDDVGAGYSGLRHILDLEPDVLKLDMSLTRGVDSDRARATLAEAMVSFAEGIGSVIVAEGIETQAEMDALRGLGVGYGQGYHLGRPMPVVAAQQFLLGAGQNETACEVRAPRRARRAAA